MLEEEAKIIRQMLSEVKGKTILNIGSSNEEYYKKTQPYIWTDLMEPLIKQGNKFINFDIKKDKGVDVIGDIKDGIKGKYDLILFCNCIEHIEFSMVDLITKLYDGLNDDGILLMSAPGVYPYHEDPIDNNYRFPTLKNWISLFEFCNNRFNIIGYAQTQEKEAPVRYGYKKMTYATIIKCVKNKQHIPKMSEKELFEIKYVLKRLKKEVLNNPILTKPLLKIIDEVKLKLDIEGFYEVKLYLKGKTKVVKKKNERNQYYFKMLGIFRQAGHLFKEENK